MIESHYSQPPSKFWAWINKEKKHAAEVLRSGWDRLAHTSINSKEAQEILTALFIHTYARIISTYPELKEHLPYRTAMQGGLKTKNCVWWEDAATLCLDVKTSLTNHATITEQNIHFIVPYTDYPLYLIPLPYCTYNYPLKYTETIYTEVVNPGPLKLVNHTWNYWGGRIPEALTMAIEPSLINAPHTDIQAVLPYTKRQIINNILLKRLVLAAQIMPLDINRFSQLSDWNSDDFGMGPAWPTIECNEAAANCDALAELDFLQRYEESPLAIPELNLFEDMTKNDALFARKRQATKTSIKELQTYLTYLGFTVEVNGVFDSKTKTKLTEFQMRWNHKNPRQPALPINGLPGNKTHARLVAEYTDARESEDLHG
jgi:hypothetical protein